MPNELKFGLLMIKSNLHQANLEFKRITCLSNDFLNGVWLVSEGDIWWASVGENIGEEINGKNRLFSRPAIIFKKLSKTLYLVIPASTRIKKGSWFVNYAQNKNQATTYLHQTKVIDYRRLWSKIGSLDPKDFNKVKRGFEKLYTPKQT